MKPQHFAQFYHLRHRDDGSPHYVEGVGSDQVAYMDGRWGLARMKAEAKAIGAGRNFDGFRIVRGTHTNPFFLTAAVIEINI